MTQPQKPAAPQPDSHDEVRGPRPIGTLAVIATLLLATSTLWLLVLGILEGRG